MCVCMDDWIDVFIYACKYMEFFFLFPQALKVPYVACFGGTDVNECLQVPARKAVMQEAVAGAASLLAFTAAMKEAALAAWVHRLHLFQSLIKDFVLLWTPG